MSAPVMWGIHRLPTRNGRRHGPDTPPRVAVIEAPSEDEALSAFAAAEQVRAAGQVVGWEIIPGHRLVITLVEGEVAYVAQVA